MKSEFQKRLISSILLIPVCFLLIIEGSILFNLFLILCFFLTILEWNKMSKKKNYLKTFGYIFLSLSFISTYLLRNHFDEHMSFILFLFVIVICISTDIGGYTFGKMFKGPRLTKISPNKTIAGMFGSYILSITSIIFLIYISSESFETNLQLNIQIFIITILISSISQIGDIVISYFKRLSKLKNSGDLIPGHGGILDRIDGMLFAFPFSFLIFLLFKI
ncbi:phosphatidate cytidylyltransferase [Candidatus Pelagibacter sp. HIMB1782]|uniref:phosphatidate cytidylyltransferase n=1 Tax=Candidatus Pelagibacter sp. HIMB1782 TaxID=3413375 RepID=UPI003F85C125